MFDVTAVKIQSSRFEEATERQRDRRRRRKIRGIAANLRGSWYGSWTHLSYQMTSISRFLSSLLPRLSEMNPRWIQGRRQTGGIGSARMEFAYVFAPRGKKKKKSMRSRYRCVLTGRRFTLIPQTGRNQYGNTTRSNRKRSLLRNTPERVDHPSPSPLLDSHLFSFFEKRYCFLPLDSHLFQ